MKKKNLLITLSVLIVLLISFTIVYVCFIKESDNPTGTDSSKVNAINHLKYNHSSNYVYTGFADIPDGYSAEDAINDGCFVNLPEHLLRTYLMTTLTPRFQVQNTGNDFLTIPPRTRMLFFVQHTSLVATTVLILTFTTLTVCTICTQWTNTVFTKPVPANTFASLKEPTVFRQRTVTIMYLPTASY